MANPQKKVLFQGIGHHATTYQTDSSLEFEDGVAYGTSKRFAPVKVVSAGTIGEAVAGDDNIIGSLDKIEGDDFAVVQDGQYIKFKGEVAEGSSVEGAAANAVAAAAEPAGFGIVVASGAESEAGAGFCIVQKY